MERPLKRVMCVDDEEDILDVVAMSLEMIGELEVHRCQSGVQALKDVVSVCPDMIVMDVMMPELDGPATLMEIRKIQEVKHIPIVFMTAHVQPEKHAELRAIGAESVISKPFDPMTLPGQLDVIWRNFSPNE